MNFLKRLFGGAEIIGADDDETQRFTVQLENGEQTPAIYVDAKANPRDALKALRFDRAPRPSLFITGGASNMSDEDKRLTRVLFEQAVAPFAQEHNITVIDGATQSGVIEMMATARVKGSFTFPLIGIVPHGRVHYVGKPAVTGEQETHPLCPGHSHFVFVSGDNFGAESEMIVNMAHVLAGGERDRAGRKASAIGLVVNGGSITRQEAFMATSKYIDIPLIVMEGSGRFADELASAVRTGETSQALIRSIIDRGNVQLVGTAAGSGAMKDKLLTAYRTDPTV